ncbi:unnamed protein product [Lymnaea stagnalis]|uniref:C2H2-type domain-containing protein n=1 Tax=Lymnaea stagnalis TaxID=6523 RepID=A0AAV2H9B2_LYMST
MEQDNSHLLNMFETFHCQHCSNVYNDKHNYRKHLCESHGHLMPFCCKICGKGSFSRQNLIFHMQGHEGRTFVCPVSNCSAKFKLKHHLMRHVRTLHSLHQCSKCLSVFRESHIFIGHLSTCKNTSV